MNKCVIYSAVPASKSAKCYDAVISFVKQNFMHVADYILYTGKSFSVRVLD